jgi:hypothetical protein
VVSLNFASWNQLVGWLRDLDGLRELSTHWMVVVSILQLAVGAPCLGPDVHNVAEVELPAWKA